MDKNKNRQFLKIPESILIIFIIEVTNDVGDRLNTFAFT